MISRLKTHYLKKMAWTLLRHVRSRTSSQPSLALDFRWLVEYRLILTPVNPQIARRRDERQPGTRTILWPGTKT